ncbi:C40 family peptidase [Kitasatospora sp. NPDC052896]|uniref:C40 family peptidase n=1 Tax=Kitasatospora sp. NPDC052896 TaxID=3364061 RepID=UPI0037CC58E2
MMFRPVGGAGGRRRFLGGLLAAAAAGSAAGPMAGGGTAQAARPRPRPRSRGGAVLAVAERQIGVPYSWGGGDRLGASLGYCEDGNGYLDGVCKGETTIGFDCSGLTLYCWYAGTGGAVQLGHYTVAQFHRGTPVERVNLAPGDLLFFSRSDAPLHHVGLYAGGNAMIHAAHTGTLVARLENVFQDPVFGPQYVGAVRPGG